MGKPLEILKQRTSDDWLIGYNSRELLELAEARYLEINQRQNSKVFICSRDPIQFLAEFIAACSTNCEIFLCNPDWVDAEWQQVQRFAHIPSLNAPLIMIPTGGTSGTIRFAMHTWETLTASVLGFRDYFEVDCVNSLCVLPLYHVSGLMQFMRSFLTDGKLAILPWKNLEAGQVPDLHFQEFFLSLVPTQLQRLLDSSLWAWMVPLRAILLGGAPAWESLLEAARSRYLPLAPTYGMTETASQIVTLKPEDFLRGQMGCGQVLPHATIQINGDQLEIQAKSLMLGYYPERLDHASYKADDLGYFDPKGFLHIVGRHSHKIITGGENVFPAEVEAAILSTKLIRDVCVIGVPDSTWGQIVTALYVPEAEFSPEKITTALKTKLSKVKHPKLWIAVDFLPRNAQGKINHSYLKLMLHNLELQTQDASQSFKTIVSTRSFRAAQGESRNSSKSASPNSTRKIPSERSKF